MPLPKPEEIKTYHREAFEYACDKLKKYIASRNVTPSTDLGRQIVAALADLPHSRERLDALPDEAKKPLLVFITQEEINFTADEIDKIV